MAGSFAFFFDFASFVIAKAKRSDCLKISVGVGSTRVAIPIVHFSMIINLLYGS